MVARLSLSVCVLRFVLLLCAVLVLCLMGLAACNKFFVRSIDVGLPATPTIAATGNTSPLAIAPLVFVMHYVFVKLFNPLLK